MLHLLNFSIVVSSGMLEFLMNCFCFSMSHHEFPVIYLSVAAVVFWFSACPAVPSLITVPKNKKNENVRRLPVGKQFQTTESVLASKTSQFCGSEPALDYRSLLPASTDTPSTNSCERSPTATWVCHFMKIFL